MYQIKIIFYKIKTESHKDTYVFGIMKTYTKEQTLFIERKISIKLIMTNQAVSV